MNISKQVRCGAVILMIAVQSAGSAKPTPEGIPLPAGATAGGDSPLAGASLAELLPPVPDASVASGGSLVGPALTAAMRDGGEQDVPLPESAGWPAGLLVGVMLGAAWWSRRRRG